MSTTTTTTTTSTTTTTTTTTATTYYDMAVLLDDSNSIGAAAFSSQMQALATAMAGQATLGPTGQSTMVSGVFSLTASMSGTSSNVLNPTVTGNINALTYTGGAMTSMTALVNN